MRWILDNLQIVIAVAAALAYWLNQRKQQSAEETEQPAEEGRPDDPFREFGADPAEAERTRRIQEEIRRKIAERTGGAPAAAPARVPEPPPLFQPEPPPPARTAALAAASAQEAVLQRQRDLEEQLRAVEAGRRAVKRKEVIAEASARKPTAARTALLGDLKGAENLRRAIVLREVLGPPVGLR